MNFTVKLLCFLYIIFTSTVNAHDLYYNNEFPLNDTMMSIIHDDHKYYKAHQYRGGKHAYFFKTIQNDIFQAGYETHNTLSNHHRLALQVDLSFEFPFYGHPIQKVAIATGGFLYMSDFLHKYLTYTQFIAPLMGDFDSSIGNHSQIFYADTGSAFHVIWKDVMLHNTSEDHDKFTFSLAIYSNGSIYFSYYTLPSILYSHNHSFEIGVSDAYYEDNPALMKRKIIEYHRIQFDSQQISTDLFIWLEPLPTCVAQTDCHSCAMQRCTWCPTLGICSGGWDRNRQAWEWENCSQQAENYSCDNVLNMSKTIRVFVLLFALLSVVVVACLCFYGYFHPLSTIGMWMIKYRPATYAARIRSLRTMVSREDKYDVSLETVP